MRPSHVLTASLTMALALAAGTASAQDAQPAPAPAPAPAADPAATTTTAPAAPAATTTTTTTTTTAEDAKKAEEDKKAEELAHSTRFRWAFHVMGGPWFVPDRTGGGGGAGLQLGVQINDMWAVYYSGTGAIAVATSNSNTGVGASAGVMAYNSVMGDVTLFRHLEIGLGPSADTLAFGSADVKSPAPGVAPGKATALAGTYFGLQTRLGLILPGKSGKSGRFMLGLEVHPTFADSTLVSTFITLGGGKF